MASAQELVPLIKDAVAQVLTANPSEAGDVRFALQRVTSEWVNPEISFHPPSEGNGGGATPEPPATPKVTGCTPSTAEIGAADLTLQVTGTGFTQASTILFNGGEEPTTFVSATRLTTIVKPSTATTPGTYPVGVVGADGEASFTFTEADAPLRSRRAP